MPLRRRFSDVGRGWAQARRKRLSSSAGLKLPDILLWPTHGLSYSDTERSICQHRKCGGEKVTLGGPSPPPGSKTDVLSWRPLATEQPLHIIYKGWTTGSRQCQPQWPDHPQPSSWGQYPFKTISSLTSPAPGTPCCSSGLVWTSSAMDKATAGQGALHWWVSIHPVLQRWESSGLGTSRRALSWRMCERATSLRQPVTHIVGWLWTEPQNTAPCPREFDRHLAAEN